MAGASLSRSGLSSENIAFDLLSTFHGGGRGCAKTVSCPRLGMNQRSQRSQRFTLLLSRETIRHQNFLGNTLINLSTRSMTVRQGARRRARSSRKLVQKQLRSLDFE